MNIFNLTIENFNGPFDIFVSLIEKKKMKIENVNISEIIDEYIEYVNNLESNKLEIKAEFLNLASYLIKLKSIEVINNEMYKKKKEEFKEILIDYSFIKKLSNVFRKKENKDVISYSINEIKKFKNNYTEDNSMLTLENLQNAFILCLNRRKKDKHETFLEVNIDNPFNYEKTKEKLHNILNEGSIQFIDLVEKIKIYDKLSFVNFFILILEEYKNQNIEILTYGDNILISHISEKEGVL